MIPAQVALERLREGNRRFVAEVRDRHAPTSQTRHRKSAASSLPRSVSTPGWSSCSGILNAGR